MNNIYKKKLLVVIFIAFIISVFIGCGGSYQHISAEKAMKMMKTEQNYLIVDVRSQEEYNKKHVKNAILVPIDDIKEGKLDKLHDKNQTLLLYCWTGRRAEKAADLLIKRGYTNVYEFGGLVDWTGDTEDEENIEK